MIVWTFVWLEACRRTHSHLSVRHLGLFGVELPTTTLFWTPLYTLHTPFVWLEACRRTHSHLSVRHLGLFGVELPTTTLFWTPLYTLHTPHSLLYTTAIYTTKHPYFIYCQSFYNNTIVTTVFLSIDNDER
jgi:hypothetical protein